MIASSNGDHVSQFTLKKLVKKGLDLPSLLGDLFYFLAWFLISVFSYKAPHICLVFNYLRFIAIYCINGCNLALVAGYQ